MVYVKVDGGRREANQRENSLHPEYAKILSTLILFLGAKQLFRFVLFVPGSLALL